VGALRAASIPLLLTVQRYVRTGAPAEGFGGADASCRLLRSLIGCIWSMLGHLHRHTPLLLSSGWLWLTRALLELSPERGCHAHATDVSISLRVEDPDVVLKVEDNGIGLPTDALSHAHSWGLQGLHERVSLCGGTLVLDNAPGSGARITVRLPINATDAAG
jgi:glucose-6-phosphate-specific signal transduction histidine kinase